MEPISGAAQRRQTSSTTNATSREWGCECTTVVLLDEKSDKSTKALRSTEPEVEYA